MFREPHYTVVDDTLHVSEIVIVVMVMAHMQAKSGMLVRESRPLKKYLKSGLLFRCRS